MVDEEEIRDDGLYEDEGRNIEECSIDGDSKEYVENVLEKVLEEEIEGNVEKVKKEKVLENKVSKLRKGKERNQQ